MRISMFCPFTLKFFGSNWDQIQATTWHALHENRSPAHPISLYVYHLKPHKVSLWAFWWVHKEQCFYYGGIQPKAGSEYQLSHELFTSLADKNITYGELSLVEGGVSLRLKAFLHAHRKSIYLENSKLIKETLLDNKK